ncbi:MAG: metallophosphoesterase [Polyangiaceae bacterium]
MRIPHATKDRMFPANDPRNRRRQRRVVGLATCLTVALGFAAAAVVSCSKDSETPPVVTREPETGNAITSTKASIVPSKARVPTIDLRAPSDPKNVLTLLAEGWGTYTVGAGRPMVDRTLDGSPAPTPTHGRKRVARFVHASDFQLADDESPSRVAAADGPPPIEGAFRPQEGYQCRVMDAMVRTLNAIHGEVPVDLVVLGGDNVDNAQANELAWMLRILDGGDAFACDSGDPNDVEPGPDNDAKDVFTPVGLDMPWLWVTGNHDAEIQGNFAVDDARIAETIGTECKGGTRDYREPGAPIHRGTVPADPARRPMVPLDLMARVGAATGKKGPPGHGIDAYARTSGHATYAYDVPGSPVRFLVVDTAAETGGADGIVRKADVEQVVMPALEGAKRDGKWVVVVSHHAVDRLGDGSSAGGPTRTDVLTPREWERIVTQNRNVILDLVGHAHTHRVRVLGSGSAGTWEMQTSALADFPNQVRLVEIWDEGGGSISIRSASVDFDTKGSVLAERARTLAILDFTTGWSPIETVKPEDENVVLWLKKP